MTKATIEVDNEELDRLIREDMTTHYKLAKLYSPEKKKLIKAFKRVIEYYGGNVDE